MNWCRLYNQTPHSPTLRRVAHDAGATVGSTLAVWTYMLCHASSNEGDARGTLTGWDDAECSLVLGIDRAVVGAIRRSMTMRLVDDGGRIMTWEKHQAVSDNSTKRWQAWNERRKQNQAPSDDPTLAQRAPNVGPTSKKRREEIREEDRATALSTAPGTPKDGRRGSRLPDGWVPSTSLQSFALDLGLNVQQVAEEFADYWRSVPGAKGCKLDWDATFRNRCREKAARLPSLGRPPAKAARPLDWFINDITGGNA